MSIERRGSPGTGSPTRNRRPAARSIRRSPISGAVPIVRIPRIAADLCGGGATQPSLPRPMRSTSRSGFWSPLGSSRDRWAPMSGNAGLGPAYPVGQSHGTKAGITVATCVRLPLRMSAPRFYIKTETRMACGLCVVAGLISLDCKSVECGHAPQRHLNDIDYRSIIIMPTGSRHGPDGGGCNCTNYNRMHSDSPPP